MGNHAIGTFGASVTVQWDTGAAFEAPGVTDTQKPR